MTIETTLSRADLRNIRDTVRSLRALADRSSGRACDIASAGGTVSLDPDQVRSVVKALESVAAAAADDDEVTPQDAAALLRMSRPTVMRLIDKGALPVRMVGTHYRLARRDVVQYRDRHAAVRRGALRDLAAMTEDLDL